MKPPGWYLALRYMQGQGLAARAPEPIEPSRHGAHFLFADRVLAQAADWRSLLKGWFGALAAGGALILWLPDCRYHELLPGEARLTLDDLAHALDDIPGWQLHEADLIDGYAYLVWEKRDDQRQWRTVWRKQPKHMLVARTGAHGDALMASSILPGLKEQGWHISFISREAGCEVLKHDPHLDELITLRTGQVPEEELPLYWEAWEKRFDAFLNLTHSVEGELLKQPARPDYFWPDEQRRRICGRSYLAHLHQMAGIPGPYRVTFYPDATEQARAAEKAAEYGSFALWCLRGSSVHKWWPYTPQAICQLLAKTNLNFVLTGDESALPLAEAAQKAARDYFGDDSRIHVLAGTHSIREIMTLAHHAAVVIGPETGVLNAVSLQPVPKILFLSHSATRNLSDDWVSVTALTPSSPCYPCHRLHYGHEMCPQDEATLAAVCAASIGIERVVQAVTESLQDKPALPWWLRGERLNNAA
ncbi:MAG: glycosyltransferase family 9 protein [Alphaproteobacteria bacterium]|nr:glycosyltransferase family 9 protein [Alphaproteobacteria bacterium]